MADPFDDIMSKHFEAAGIVDDPPPEGQETQPAGSGNETVPETGKEDVKLVGQDGKDIILDDAKPKHELQDKPSGKVDGTKEQGKKEEGEGSLNPGDLKLTDGTVVKAGAERRWYQRYENTRQEATLVRNELNQERQLRTNLETKVNALTEAAKAVGVESPVEMQTAISLFKDLRDNPVGTVKALLTDLKAKGYSIDGIGSQIDTAAVTRLIDQKLGTSVEAKGPSPEEIQNEAINEVRTFFGEFPDAVIHEDVINDFIVAEAKKGSVPSLTQAYFTVKNAFADQGFDWSKPLAPQVEAKKAAAQGQQQQQQPQRKPIVNGSNVQDNSVEADATKVNVQFDSFDDAIRWAVANAK